MSQRTRKRLLKLSEMADAFDVVDQRGEDLMNKFNNVKVVLGPAFVELKI